MGGYITGMLLQRLHTAKAVDTGRLTTGGVPARRVIAQALVEVNAMGSASGHVEFLSDVCHPFGVCTLLESADERLKMKTKEVHISI